MPSVLILNGPNLNLLGTREPETYGATTLADIEDVCGALCRELGWDMEFLQSNHEGALVDALHGANGRHDGIVFNAGAYTHTSVALYDAISAIEPPCIEVHVSNVHGREKFRHHSYLSPVSKGIIVGFGAASYTLGIRALSELSVD